MTRVYVGAFIRVHKVLGIDVNETAYIKDFFVSESTGTLNAVISQLGEHDKNTIDLETDLWFPLLQEGDEVYVHTITGERLEVPHLVSIGEDELSNIAYFEPPLELSKGFSEDLLNTFEDEFSLSEEISTQIEKDINRLRELFKDVSESSVFETPKETYFDFGGDLEEYTGTKITDKSINFTAKIEDVVNSPSHYNYGDIEVIDFIEQVTSQCEDGFAGYILGNCLKYLSRAEHKGGKEDLEKAYWYLGRLLGKH